MSEKTPQEVIAGAFVQSWDQHIGHDGAIAVLNTLGSAGLTVSPSPPKMDCYECGGPLNGPYCPKCAAPEPPLPGEIEDLRIQEMP